MQKIIPNLWFDHQAEEAVRFYCSVFKQCRIKQVALYGEAASKAAGRPVGSVLTVTFQLEGQDFVAINGGPLFKFTPAISLMVNCRTQAEIDHLWSKLSADPASEACGWLKDKYGVSWQIVPIGMDRAMKNPETAERVMQALLTMKKLNMAKLKRAAQKKRPGATPR